jgi:hypothetical protein
MAALHVAGAAAILAQQHPDWSGARFKPVLMSTATPTADVLDQGAGRIDVARAVGQRVTTEGGSLSFGAFRWPRGPEPVSRTVTYRNDGDAAVTLTLGGLPAPFTVTAGQVTVPAHGTAGVAVSVTPAAGAAGQHQGRLTDVAWTFREPGSAAPVAPLPLLVVRAGGAGLDDQGRAPAGCAYPLVLTVQHQPGAAAPKLASLRVAASFDDGATWRPVPVSGGRALVGHPARAGFVSLRISATDAAGNSVEQTVIRAYQTVEVPRGHPST